MQRKCSMCNRDMERNWQFCPYCGNVLSQIPGNQLITMVQDMVSKISPLLNGMLSFSGPDSTNANQRNTVRRSSARTDLTKAPQKVDQVIEPMDESVKSDSSIIHRIMLPGVSKRSEITITRMETSIEVRAFAGKKLYMKIIPVEKRYRISSQALSDGVLTIELNKV